MKKFIQLLSVLYIVYFFAACSKEKCEDPITPKANKEIANLFSVDSVAIGSLGDYHSNLDVLRNVSYFNLRNEMIYFETVVPNRNFRVLNVYHVFNKFFPIILVHVTDSTAFPARTSPKKYFLRGKVQFKDITDVYPNQPSFTPQTGGSVLVIIYNDNGIISFKELFQPKESGGGVIIEGP